MKRVLRFLFLWKCPAHFQIAFSLILLFAGALTANAQTAVRGQVVDETGSGLPGVNILVKGTTNGTTSDASGNYSLDVSDANSVLVYSFIGYESQEITVGGRSRYQC